MRNIFEPQTCNLNSEKGVNASLLRVYNCYRSNLGTKTLHPNE